jgi:hypothetical protein
MSLTIDVDKVRGVLLADKWHLVAKGTFMLSSHEFVKRPEGANQEAGTQTLHRSGDDDISATWFQFTDVGTAEGLERNPGNTQISGPLSAILAVQSDLK